MFQKLKVNKWVEIVIFATILSIICFSYVKARLYAPPKGIVDGIYRNTCCADIVIREPKISHGNDTFDIKISDMKFGLTGIVVGQFIADGIQKSDKDTWLSFSKEGENRVINLPIGNNEYSFRRIEGSTLSK